MSDDAKTDRELLLETRQDVRYLVTARADHETRLRAVEHKVWWAVGFAAAVGVALKFVL